jgi:hypothetical protein|tara:strand:+ start:138 stop:449 length:312 start_codon:yes stop_codon:yes gene_type:complete
VNTIRIGIVGDLHAHWDDVDAMQLSDCDYDLLLFTGDLGGGARDSSLRMARSMSRLTLPALVYDVSPYGLTTYTRLQGFGHQTGIEGYQLKNGSLFLTSALMV